MEYGCGQIVPGAVPAGTKVSATLYNVQGQAISTVSNEESGHNLEWDTQNLENGRYYVLVRAAGQSETRPLVKLSN